MHIYQCDRCGGALDMGGFFHVGYALGPHVELCFNCFQPFVDLLKAKALLSAELANRLSDQNEDENNGWCSDRKQKIY